MKFDARMTIVNATTDANPISAPGSVLDAKVIGSPVTPLMGGSVIKRILLGLEGVTTETVTLSLYALDDNLFHSAVKADWKYHLIAAAVVVTNGELAEVTAKVPPGGLVYFRVTAETVAANRELVVAFAE